MRISDEKMLNEGQGANGCFFIDNEEDGCVVDWGRCTVCCPHLKGVWYNREFYGVSSYEFRTAFSNVFPFDEKFLEWECSYKEDTDAEKS